MPASNLIERVAELIAGGEELVPDALRPQLAELQRRLREPVRVAVVGRVSAGKSTMVNALLGQRVAPTDVSECTRLVTWFHYGHPQHLQIELKAGGTLDAQLTPDGTLPNSLDVPPEDIQGLHCYLANDLLKWMTLIDTPGIGSVHGEFSATTQELLAQEADSAAAAQRADAVVFLFNQVLMQDELEALQMFRAASGNDPTRSAASAVGVLSKADQLGDGTRDPWSVAVELAGVYAGKFRNEVAAVVPVVGLVAEASEAATLTELDTKQLAMLAAMDEKAFAELLWSTDRFVSAEAPVSSEVRERLLGMLDLYGVQNAVKFLRQGAHGAFALRRELSGLSGISEVKRTLATYFSEQDHVLKVRSALDWLNRLTFTHVEGPAAAGLRRIQRPGRRTPPRCGYAPRRRARGMACVLHRPGEALARTTRRGLAALRSGDTWEQTRDGQRGQTRDAASLSGRNGPLAEVHRRCCAKRGEGGKDGEAYVSVALEGARVSGRRNP